MFTEPLEDRGGKKERQKNSQANDHLVFIGKKKKEIQMLILILFLRSDKKLSSHIFETKQKLLEQSILFALSLLLNLKPFSHSKIYQFFYLELIYNLQSMISITQASQKHAADIADFQVKMALQTQNLKLDPELVNKAAHYVIKNSSYGQYYVPVDPSNPEKALGSILITYENAQSWWIQSVYVREEHRKKGVFTKMFGKILQQGKSRKAKKIQLYVEKQNIKAKNVYQKLGMHINGNQFIGFELVYGQAAVIQQLKSQIDKDTKILECDHHNDKLTVEQIKKLQKISGQVSQMNRKLKCLSGQTLIGYCEYFYEFSDWRFGLIIYINFFSSRQNSQLKALNNIMKHIFQKSPLKIGAIRIIGSSKEMEALQKIAPKLHQDVYDVMQINL